ncbi:MAG: inositol monophosphatase family protein [Pseudomonadota bacterium]
MRQSDNAAPADLDDLALAITACRAGGEQAASHFRKVQAVNKAEGGDYDPVTEGDKSAERAVRAVLEAGRPDDDILGEEFGFRDTGSDRRWVIDPIDGTRAFVCGTPTWGTLVGLQTGGAYTLGAAFQPLVGDMFSGDGDQAFLNGAAISTRKGADMDDLRLATTDDILIDEPYRDNFQALKAKSAITRYGLDWYAYGLLAAGYIDVVFECGLQLYDIAALVPIVRGAGGIVTDVRGGQDIGPTVVAAANAAVHEHALSILNR